MHPDLRENFVSSQWRLYSYSLINNHVKLFRMLQPATISAATTRFHTPDTRTTGSTVMVPDVQAKLLRSGTMMFAEWGWHTIPKWPGSGCWTSHT